MSKISYINVVLFVFVILVSGCNQKLAAEEKWQKVLNEAKLSYAKQCADRNQCQLAQRFIMDCLKANPKDEKLQQYLVNIKTKICIQGNQYNGKNGL